MSAVRFQPGGGCNCRTVDQFADPALAMSDPDRYSMPCDVKVAYYRSNPSDPSDDDLITLRPGDWLVRDEGDRLEGMSNAEFHARFTT